MKIVDRETFLSLPKNTLYSKFEPNVFGPLKIKGDTVIGKDFHSSPIIDAIDDSNDDRHDLLESAVAGKSLKMDFHTEYRDALFDDSQLFAVCEPDDIRLLISRLHECLPGEG